MEIKNELKSNDKEDKDKPKFVSRSLAEVQRAKLEKLMKNPDKPVVIPERQHQEKDFSQNVKSFVRNVMGSSAGAGSGEFHVYRHLRRKEYARQKYIQLKSEKEILDDQYQAKLEENQRLADEKTAKKRAKRQKKKQKAKNKAKQPKLNTPKEDSDESEKSEDSDKESEEEKSDKESTEEKPEEAQEITEDQNSQEKPEEPESKEPEKPDEESKEPEKCDASNPE